MKNPFFLREIICYDISSVVIGITSIIIILLIPSALFFFITAKGEVRKIRKAKRMALWSITLIALNLLIGSILFLLCSAFF